MAPRFQNLVVAKKFRVGAARVADDFGGLDWANIDTQDGFVCSTGNGDDISVVNGVTREEIHKNRSVLVHSNDKLEVKNEYRGVFRGPKFISNYGRVALISMDYHEEDYYNVHDVDEHMEPRFKKTEESFGYTGTSVEIIKFGFVFQAVEVAIKGLNLALDIILQLSLAFWKAGAAIINTDFNVFQVGFNMGENETGIFKGEVVGFKSKTKGSETDAGPRLSSTDVNVPNGNV